MTTVALHAGHEPRGVSLPAYSVFAAMLAAAGLPIYIHAPKVYAEDYGIGLGALGVALFGLRLFDLVQDPLLGWVVSRLGKWRGAAVAAGVVTMASAMLALFAVPAPIAPLAWFALSLAILFSAYSFLTIAFYARGVTRASEISGGHLQMAGWREGGSLGGVCAAAMAPALLVSVTASPYAGYAVGFALLCGVALVAMRGEWAGDASVAPGGFGRVLHDGVALRLLLLALVNAAPLAVTSTLFLFFVESRLAAPGWEGPLLIVFFLSAALAAPVWSRLARRFGARNMLLFAMLLSIVGFAFSALLGPGDAMIFALVCVGTGAMVGADLVILPAVFARRLARIAPDGGAGFGLWSFAGKATLALAAVALLPLLQQRGFVVGGTNAPEALDLLATLYALVPCGLKVVAVLLLLATPFDEE